MVLELILWGLSHFDFILNKYVFYLICREDSSNRYLFTRHLVDDKSESTMNTIKSVNERATLFRITSTGYKIRIIY